LLSKYVGNWSKMKCYCRNIINRDKLSELSAKLDIHCSSPTNTAKMHPKYRMGALVWYLPVVFRLTCRAGTYPGTYWSALGQNFRGIYCEFPTHLWDFPSGHRCDRQGEALIFVGAFSLFFIFLLYPQFSFFHQQGPRPPRQ